jgi:uncharacterized protein
MIRPLSRCAAFSLAASLLLSGAQAQQAPPRPAQPQGGAPAPAANLSPTHLALARELTTMMGLSRLVDPILPAFGQQLRQRTVTRPELTKDLDQVLEALKPELEQQRQVMLDTTVRLYANAFTEAELKDLVAYFKTPTGQKYFQVTPKVLDLIDVETRRWAERVSEYVMVRVRAEMGKRGHQM